MKKIILYVLFTSILFNLSCTHSSEPEENPDDMFVPQLSPIPVSWNAENSIVCFGTSLTFGYGAGAKVPFCKDDSQEESISKQKNIGIRGFVKKYLSFSTRFILEKQKLGVLDFETKKIMYGICGCTGDSSYPRFMSEKLKIKVYNQGYVAMRSDQAYTLIQDSVLSKRPSLVLLEFGANDFLQGISDSAAEVNISAIIEKIKLFGSKIVLIGFIHPDMANHINGDNFFSEKTDLALRYYNMYKRLAAKYDLLYIEYPLYKIFGEKNYMSDGIHPNGNGYIKMNENIMKSLSRTFDLNKMLK